MIRTVLGIALLATLASAAPLAAQTPRAPAPAAAPPVLQAPYEPQLLRLAEIMGALHYLIGLCQGPENSAWRREMQALLDAEATGGERRERLVQSFNRGYGGFEQAHRGCTPVARLATQRYVTEARKLVADIAGRYGN